MLPGRFVDRPTWERMLRELGAEPLAGKAPLNTAEWWRRPGHPPFTLPVEDDGKCDFWAFRRIYEAQGERPLSSPPA
jgi:hypothetical protein